MLAIHKADWRDNLSERQQKELELARFYVSLDFAHPGPPRMALIDYLAELLDACGSDASAPESAKEPVVTPALLWDRDLCSELRRGTKFTNRSLIADNGWWQRRLDQITGVTIHHTLSNSPHATARHYVTKGGGRPSIPYTIWVTETGEVLLCVELEEGLWHDHTGHRNVHLSIGMAGTLHIHKPSVAQLEAVIKVCVWAIKSDALPGMTDISQVKGHRNYVATVCPGWKSKASGYWREQFYARLERSLKPGWIGYMK